MSTWVLYGIVAAAIVLPSLLAFRWRGEVGSLKTEVDFLKHEVEQDAADYLEMIKSIQARFDEYRDIVENSGDTPASIIDKLREQGRID